MAISTDHIELRKTPRSIRDIRINCRHGGIEYAGTLIDLSEEGAGIVMAQPHRLNDILSIDGIEDGRGAREARVCWVRKANSHYRIGMAFR